MFMDEKEREKKINDVFKPIDSSLRSETKEVNNLYVLINIFLFLA